MARGRRSGGPRGPAAGPRTNTRPGSGAARQAGVGVGVGVGVGGVAVDGGGGGEVEVVLGLDEPDDLEALRHKAAKALGVATVPFARIVRKAIDARRGSVRFRVVLSLSEPPDPSSLGAPWPREVNPRPARVVIVGDGPCGLFCAYELARQGIASIVLDRGKEVQPRRIDLKGLNRLGVVDEDSNYCFGEGGAGTYSDGKLYTRATKRGDVTDVLETLALHGAPVDILTDARPHIGSNLLPKVVTSIRERLAACGVEVRFGKRVVDVVTTDSPSAGRHVSAVKCADGDEIPCDAVVVATGHSARDVYRTLHARGVRLEAKPLAMGVRIEHPQPLINEIQYGSFARHEKLPSAAYRLAFTDAAIADGGRGVFSFCMCPGGFVVPASTEHTGLVVNGMSLKRRDSPYANSGIVVAVEIADGVALGKDARDPFALLELQDALERAALAAGGGKLKAPAIRATDFVAGRTGSSTLPSTSYQPGLHSADVAAVLDASGVALAARMKRALREFDKQMRGYLTEEAVLIGVETRTSAPVRIPRDDDTLESLDVKGLYPGGEGAGYAGGIVSAALDGVRIAKKIASRYE